MKGPIAELADDLGIEIPARESVRATEAIAEALAEQLGGRVIRRGQDVLIRVTTAATTPRFPRH